MPTNGAVCKWLNELGLILPVAYVRRLVAPAGVGF